MLDSIEVQTLTDSGDWIPADFDICVSYEFYEELVKRGGAMTLTELETYIFPMYMVAVAAQLHDYKKTRWGEAASNNWVRVAIRGVKCGY